MHTSHHIELDKLSLTPPDVLQNYRSKAVAVAGIFGLATLICFFVDFHQAAQAYLVGFLMFLGLTLGPTAWLLIWFMPGGRWGLSMRRIWEAASRNIWVAAAAFVPIAFFYKTLYPWADPNVVAQNHHLQNLVHKYLNGPMFIGRAILYFVIWGFVIFLINKFSAMQDKPYEGWLGGKLTALGAVGVLGYIWAMSFASIDWVMSLTPGWPSTIFPLVQCVGQAILGLAIGIIAGSILVPFEPMNELMDDVVFHDNGKLLLACVMLWAYFGFSQWLIIWSGNLPEEIHWFRDRIGGGWGPVALFLVVFHFAVPFAILLSQHLKKVPTKLAAVAVWMIFMRFVDLFWIIAPSFNKEHFAISKVWMYPVVTLFMVGLWAVFFFRNLAARPLIAAYDPRLVQIYGETHE